MPVNLAVSPQSPALAGPAPVLVISHDLVGSLMAGPGIRYYQMATVLAKYFPVVLAVPEPSTLTGEREFEVLRYAAGDAPVLEAAVCRSRVVVIAAIAVVQVPALLRAGVPLAIDGHDPFQAETLFLIAGQASDQSAALMVAYLAGDFFMCASERQRDWWLGLLEASGRVNAETHHDDPTLRRLVDVVPPSPASDPPRHTRWVVKDVWPGIGADDKVLLWGGGLWPWLDPLTAVRAASLMWRKRQDIRLVFPGTRHPNPGVAGLPNLANSARDLARELGLLDKAVFFGDWVSYADWPNYLLESDVALTLHPRDTLEARLAYRTRVLDYLWAGLPTVATKGDVLADLIDQHGLGAVIEPERPEAVAEAVLRLLDIPKEVFAPKFSAARQALAWETAARPLIEFCRRPRLAPDKVSRGARLGNAYYVSRIADLEKKLHWYEGHRMLRLLRRMDPIVSRSSWLRRWVRH
jgi:glycosyltransferase involved in cell wall biosynthesis